ncbi:sulfotransferase [Dokdonella sp.]|uniref:tetratricopeptide repeat-containing sulfotransferase family protein n=1 Tax=Dokdonella sp. TaxID=2291710 RepID=UPI0025BD5C89|nr:sulfotransferase [Dokdonella sp.]MBX3689619.1 sulfotransferase [Dokdonella sp.]
MTLPAVEANRAVVKPELARQLAELQGQPSSVWLDHVRELVLAADLDTAANLLATAVTSLPFDAQIQLAQAGVMRLRGEVASAEQVLRELLVREPAHFAAAFELANLLSTRGARKAAGEVLRATLTRMPQGADLAMRAAKQLADWGDKAAAVEIAEAAISAGANEPMLWLYLAALQGQLGAFERARACYLAAIERDPRMLEFGAAYGLVTVARHVDRGHPDLARLRDWLALPELGQAARASLLFAHGKVADDLGDFTAAAAYFREANTLIGARGWSCKAWRRVVEARLGAAPVPARSPAADEPTPIFIVGAPRSGTTLVAELLGRSPQTRNRGELDWLPAIADELARAAKVDRSLLDAMAARYLDRLRDEDAQTRWFIDKQPLNFMHLDLIGSLFPQAIVIHCHRNSRDTALSIWSQHFESHDYRFAYDFGDIACVFKGCSRLLAKARRHSAARILEVRYEALAREPQRTVDALAAAIGLDAFECSAPQDAIAAIGTASLWQARQPVYTRSIGRWHAYAAAVPELLAFADD